MESSANAPLTFLFTDIEGSIRLWEQAPDEMSAALARHDALLSGVIEAAGGHVFKTTGDGVCAAFADPRAACQAAVELQRAVLGETWPEGIGQLKARVAVQTGVAE